MADRRDFIRKTSLGAAALFAGRVWAADVPMLKETDPQAAALGYKTNASEVDKAKYTKFAAGQKCANCALFQGKPTDAAGVCPLYAGKMVAANAWCSAYNKKAG